MRLQLYVLVSLISVFPVQAHADAATDPQAADATGSAVAAPPSAADTAIVKALTTCMTAEGDTITADDQLALQQVAPGLSAALSAGAGVCAGAATPDACAAIIGKLSCDNLAAALTPNLPALPAQGPTPGWATQYAAGIAGMIVQCYTAETGGPPGADDQTALTSFQSQLAQLFGVLGSAGLCTVDETGLPVCLATLKSTPCDTIGAQLDAEDPATLQNLLMGCTGLIKCGGTAVRAELDSLKTP